MNKTFIEEQQKIAREEYVKKFHDLNSIDSKNQFRVELSGQLPNHFMDFCDTLISQTIFATEAELVRVVKEKGNRCFYCKKFDPQCERCIARQEMEEDINSTLIPE